MDIAAIFPEPTGLSIWYACHAITIIQNSGHVGREPENSVAVTYYARITLKADVDGLEVVSAEEKLWLR